MEAYTQFDTAAIIEDEPILLGNLLLRTRGFVFSTLGLPSCDNFHFLSHRIFVICSASIFEHWIPIFLINVAVGVDMLSANDDIFDAEYDVSFRR